MTSVARPPLVAAALLFAALFTSVDARADTIPPPTPTFVTAAPYGCRRVDITWHNDYDSGSGLAYYNLYRRRADATVVFEGSVLGDVAPFLAARRRMIWYMDDTNFQVGIEGVDRAGNHSATAWSTTVMMPTPSSVTCQDVYRPSLPTGLSATLSGGTCAEVTLTWNDNATDTGFVSSGVRGYNIYRDDEWLYFKNRVGVMRQEDRFGLVPGQTYTYGIKTIDNAGFESSAPTTVSIAIPADCRHRTPSGDRSIDVIGVRFPDQTAAPLYTMAQLDTKLFAELRGVPSEIGTSARAFFQETSYGRATFHRQTLSPTFYTLPHPTSYYCTTILPTGEGTSCNTNAIVQDAKLVSGLTTPTGDLLMVLAAGAVENSFGGNIIRLNPNKPTLDEFLGTAVHELSHSFGVQHSADWDCPGYFGAGPDVFDMQLGCDGPFYGGDGYSPLGLGKLKHHPAFTKRLMGFLGAVNTQSITVDGDYTIGRIETLSASRPEQVNGSTIKELTLGSVEDYSAAFTKGPLYSIEYRTSTGYDGVRVSGGDAPFDGVLVHVVPHRFHGTDANTYLVAKLLPASGANIFYDPATEIGVKLTSTTDLKAVVTVCGIHGTICPPEFAASIPPWQ